MSFFSEANEDAYSVAPEGAALGPRAGFLDAFDTAYQTQVRTSAMYGIEKAFHELEAAQVDNLRKAGVEDIPHLAEGAFGLLGSGAFSGEYMDVARFYQDGGDPQVAERMSAYDKKIEEYKKKFPELGLRNSGEMWGEIRTTAQQVERRAANERNTWGGTAGMLAGGVAGALNVESDPLNFATVPFGTIGRSVLRRIAGQSVAQGFIEALNQVTGVQEQRRLLGLDYGAVDALSRVGGAAIGGGLLQGAGEALGAAGRRFFRNTPADPSPPAPLPAPERQLLLEDLRPNRGDVTPDQAAAQLAARPQTYAEYLQEVSPLSTSRAGKARTVLDVDNVRTQLDDWSGPNPAFTTPKTDTAITAPRSEFSAQGPTIFDRVANAPDTNTLARQIDPDTFRVYDKLADENVTYRRWLDELKAPRNEKADTALKAIDDKIEQLRDKANRSGKMKGKKYAQQIAELTAEREAQKTELLAKDTPDMRRVRAAMLRNDEKMRDMAPVVSRAYARAQNKWDNTAKDREAINAMIREGRKSVDLPGEDAKLAETLPKSLYDVAPILQQAAKVEAQLKPGADAADIAAKIHEVNAKDAEVVLETYRAAVQKIVKDAEDVKAKVKAPVELKPGETPPDEIRVPGVKETLHLDRDKITVPNLDGNGEREITLRQLLTEQRDAEDNLKAVQSCSIR